jgi:hypothetical protein
MRPGDNLPIRSLSSRLRAKCFLNSGAAKVASRIALPNRTCRACARVAGHLAGLELRARQELSSYGNVGTKESAQKLSEGINAGKARTGLTPGGDTRAANIWSAVRL